jgi:hypothetical protein
MTAIAQKLDAKFVTWTPETVTQVERLVEEIIELADANALEILRSRRVEQEVLDAIDED